MVCGSDEAGAVAVADCTGNDGVAGCVLTPDAAAEMEECSARVIASALFSGAASA
jgi:hypothetical protein